MLFKDDLCWELICHSERIRLGIGFFVTATMPAGFGGGGGGGEILSWRNERYRMLKLVFKNTLQESIACHAFKVHGLVCVSVK
jgi:hypothetical protein